MYSRIHGIIHFIIALALIFAGVAAAQAPPSAPGTAQPSATTATLRGHITDPTGALIPGAKVTVVTATGKTVATATADAAGAYEVRGLPPSGYVVSATYEGFAAFQSPIIVLGAGQAKRVDIAMAIETAQQNIVVTDETPTVNIEAGGNASAVVLKGKDLDALSDDPDELSSELSALAGPSAGPNGGQVYIDGFTGGQLPPKSAIREIRINQNPFSAEYDKLGYGRIEILTKPGTDKLHGQFFAQGNDDAFNTGNPYTKSTPTYHSIQFNGTLNGALSKKASFFISAEQRNIQNVSLVYNPNGTVAGGLLNPHTRTNISPRLDFALGEKNTLTLRYQFYRDAESGELGGTQQSSSQATNSDSIEHTVQLSDSYVINDRIVNETRFQYLRENTTTTGSADSPQAQTLGYFTGGGASAQLNNDHQDHLELWNITTMSEGAHAIKFGTRVRDYRDANTTNQSFNGIFTFGTENTYQNAQTALNGASFVSGLSAAAGNQPSQLSFNSAPAGKLGTTVNMFDAALFFQDDWKVNHNLTASAGLRFETQNHIADHNDWAPRVSFAYALDGHKKGQQAKTVLRGGYGFFYDRLPLADLLAATRYSLTNPAQIQTVIYNPTCFSSVSVASLTAAQIAACGTPVSSQSQIAPNFHAPVTEQLGASIERQLTKTTTLTATYLRSFGAHQLVTRNANAPLPSTDYQVRPNPTGGNINQYYSEAVFKQNQMILNVNARIRPNFGLFGFYNLTSANSDGGAASTVSNSYDLSQDYGRASFASRNMVFMMANYTGPWAIRFNPFLVAQSGKPYNIVTNQDLTGDSFFNHRPSLAASSSCSTTSAQFVDTSFGCFNLTPGPGEAPIPINLGNGPAAVAVNLRVSRAWGIGPKVESSGNNGGGPPGGGGGGGGRGGPGGGGPGGGLGPGGLGGGGRPQGMGGPGTGRKYSLTFSAQALNLFNDIDRGTPIGTISPNPVYDSSGNVTGYDPGSLFQQSTSLAGGIFSSGSAARRIYFQAVFSF